MLTTLFSLILAGLAWVILAAFLLVIAALGLYVGFFALVVLAWLAYVVIWCAAALVVLALAFVLDLLNLVWRGVKWLAGCVKKALVG